MERETNGVTEKRKNSDVFLEYGRNVSYNGPVSWINRMIAKIVTCKSQTTSQILKKEEYDGIGERVWNND